MHNENGKLCQITNGSGELQWVFRWTEILADGSEKRRKRTVGPVASISAEDAKEVVKPWLVAVGKGHPAGHSIQTMGELVADFRARELVDKGPDGRAWSTRDRYEPYLDRIEQRWGNERLDSIVAGEVEEWLRQLKKLPKKKRKEEKEPVPAADPKPLSPGSKAKIRDIMSVLFNHAIRWRIYSTNPISGPARKAGVRQSGMRQETPDLLELDEMRSLLEHLAIREKALVSTDMITGIRRSELTGLQWADIDFENLLIHIRRAVVDQVTGACKTLASKAPIPIDEYTAEDLLAWYRVTPYREPTDWVFATDSARAGKKRGKQPLWLAKIMQYHIQPLLRDLGITKKVAWHTFRRTFTSLLTANGENVKVVQELLRHSSSKVTLDIYAQAKMQDKRRAQHRIAMSLHQPRRKARKPPQRALVGSGKQKQRVS